MLGFIKNNYPWFYPRFEKLIDLLTRRTFLTLFIIFILALLITLIPLKHLSQELIETTAVQNANLYSQAISELRIIYTSEVVKKMQAAGISVTHDYHLKEKAIPLPVNISMLLGKRIGEKGNGGETKLYSPYPFPWRKKEGGLRTQFAKDAWEALSKNPGAPYYRFNSINNKKVLQYATADIMKPTCVSCHNAHPQSPKKGWKEGDVRGILEVTLPLDKINAQSNTGIIVTTFYTMGISLLILILLALIIKRLKTANIQLKVYSQKREENSRELFSVINQEKRKISANLHDNIGQIISASMLNLSKLNLEKEHISEEKQKLNKNLENLLKDAYKEIKNLSYSVLPEKVHNMGLINSISELLTRAETISEISTEFDVKCDESSLSDDIKSSIYFMVQEMMSNVLKHSKATKVIVQLIQNDETIILMVEDNGIGFDINEKTRTDGLGLKNLQARTMWLNGMISIDSSLNEGTIITIEYPIKK